MYTQGNVLNIQSHAAAVSTSATEHVLKFQGGVKSGKRLSNFQPFVT